MIEMWRDIGFASLVLQKRKSKFIDISNLFIKSLRVCSWKLGLAPYTGIGHLTVSICHLLTSFLQQLYQKG